MIYTLEQLSNGEVACTNDGTLEQMIAVLKHCFPNDNYDYNSFKSVFSGCSAFCKNLDVKEVMWVNCRLKKELDLPTQSVKEFYKQLQPQFEVGSWYYANDNQKLYIKVKTVSEDGFSIDSEVIWNSGLYQEKNNSSKDNIRLWTKLENLSEIQQYLPPNHSDLITMKKQYLTRKQLVQLHKADDCVDWKKKISSYLHVTSLENDSYEILINQCDIDLLKKEGTTHQKQLLQTLGIKLSNEIEVKELRENQTLENEDAYFININNHIIALNKSTSIVTTVVPIDNYKKHSIKGKLITTPLTLQIKIN